MKKFVFTVVIEEDPFEDGRMAYHIHSPALAEYGAATWGFTREEALKNIREVVQMIVEELIDDGFYLRSQRGSHQRYFHHDGRKVTLTFHSQGDTLPPKALKRIIEKQAKWTEWDLKRLKFLK